MFYQLNFLLKLANKEIGGNYNKRNVFKDRLSSKKQQLCLEKQSPKIHEEKILTFVNSITCKKLHYLN